MNIKHRISKFKTIYQVLSKIKSLIYTSFFYIFRVFRMRNKIVFESFGGKSYSCNPKAISEAIHKLNPEIEIVWLFKNPQIKKNVVPEYIKTVKSNSMGSIYELVSSKIWVDNACKAVYSRKRKNQYYIQTWHGDRGFKKILYDVRTKLPNGHYSEGDLFETKNADCITVGSEFGIRKIKGAFGYTGRLLKYGSPRNDVLLTDDKVAFETIKKKLGLSIDEKVILFAPTFRGNIGSKIQKVQGLDLDEVVKALENKSNQKWVALIRAHSASGGLTLDGSDSSKIIDVSSYEDIADLLLIADIFITDYSSSAGDYILRKKPLILYQPDRVQYMKNNRTFYFDITNSPYAVAENQNELLEEINYLSEENANKNCEDVMNFYGVFETGRSTKEVVKYIQEILSR